MGNAKAILPLSTAWCSGQNASSCISLKLKELLKFLRVLLWSPQGGKQQVFNRAASLCSPLNMAGASCNSYLFVYLMDHNFCREKDFFYGSRKRTKDDHCVQCDEWHSLLLQQVHRGDMWPAFEQLLSGLNNPIWPPQPAVSTQKGSWHEGGQHVR